MAELLDLVLLAEQREWRSEDPLALTVVAQHLRTQKPVVIVQEIGARDWHQQLPATATVLDEVPVDPDPAVALLIISDRSIRPRPDVDRLAILRPPTLTLGVACQRNVTQEDLDEALRELCRREGFSSMSLAAVGASARRKQHGGLEEFAEKRRLPLLLYPEQTLSRSPWEKPGKMAGTCVISAILAAGVSEPVVESRPFFGKLTMALARRKQ